MIVIRTPIFSCASSNDHRTWYDLSCDENGKLNIGLVNFGGEALGVAATQHDVAKGVADAQFAHGWPMENGERIAIMATLDGVIEYIPETKLNGVYQAHLGFYDPVTDTLDLLEFIDDHEGCVVLAQSN